VSKAKIIYVFGILAIKQTVSPSRPMTCSTARKKNSST